MNKRILELAEQARVEIELDDYGETRVASAYGNSLERFAELIVRECFKSAMIESKGHMNPIDLMKRMKERVGVEE